MGKRIIILHAFLCLCADAFAAMTLIQRETFEGVATRNSDNLGGLAAITGNLYQRPVGPRVAPATAPGWSVCINTNNQVADFTIPTGAGQTNGVIGAWFYIGTPNASAVNTCHLLMVYCTPLAGFGILTLRNTGGIDFQSYNATTQTNIITVPFRQWFYLGLGWAKGGAYTHRAYYKLPGGSLTQIGLDQTGNNFNNAFTVAKFGSVPNGSVPFWKGRIGTPGIYSLDSLSDVVYPSDIIEPIDERHTWYVNPSTGNDSNSGISSDSAWQSISKVNDEMALAGVFALGSDIDTGDTVSIDNTSAPLDLGTNQLRVVTDSLKIVSVGSMKAHSVLNPAGWIKTDGYANTYQTTDGGAMDLVGAVLWEDDKWMNHPTGANFAAVANSLDSTPGSFYSDGTNIYTHPFGSTNPASDGKTYTRSRNRKTIGDSAISIMASNVWVDGLWIGKTCLARSTDSDPYNGYCISWDAGSKGTCRLSNFNLWYWSKHGAGRVASASDLRVERLNGLYGPGTPYVGFGGQTADVDFCGSGAGNSYLYSNCLAPYNVGTVGTTGGVSSIVGFWTSHGTGTPFSGGRFENCKVYSRINEQAVTSGAIEIERCVLGDLTVGCDIDVQQSKLTAMPVTINNAAKSGTVRNSILQITQIVTTDWATISGGLTFEGCTIDLRGNTSSGMAIWKRIGVTSVTFRNCVFILNSSASHAILKDFLSTDTIVMDNNCFVLGSLSKVALSYNDGSTTADRTFAQWQALGFDSGSVVSDPRLSANYRPYSKIPTWHTGAEIGPFSDYSGKVFQSRRTAGAYEYATPNPRFIFKQ